MHKERTNQEHAYEEVIKREFYPHPALFQLLGGIDGRVFERTVRVLASREGPNNLLHQSLLDIRVDWRG